MPYPFLLYNEVNQLSICIYLLHFGPRWSVMHWSALAAITKDHRPGGLYNTNYFLPVLSLEVQGLGVGRFGFFWGLSPWFEDGHLLAVSSNGYHSWVIVCVLISSYKDNNHIGWGPTHMTNFTHPFRGLISKYSHILKNQELGCQHMNGGGTQFST